MNEDDARQKIRAAFNRLRASRSSSDEDDVKGHSSTVDYHIDAIRQAGDGQWNEVIARDYVQNLEEQLEEEIEESNPNFRSPYADDSVIPEETDDPVRELGVSSRELRDELRKLDGDADDDDTYNSEDMREYIEDADDEAGEDERYKYRD